MAAYSFEIHGEFGDAESKLVELVDHAGNVTGFILPDGRSVQLVMALEVISSDVEYVTKEVDMEKLGLSLLNYDSLTFTKE